MFGSWKDMRAWLWEGVSQDDNETSGRMIFVLFTLLGRQLLLVVM